MAMADVSATHRISIVKKTYTVAVVSKYVVPRANHFEDTVSEGWAVVQEVNIGEPEKVVMESERAMTALEELMYTAARNRSGD